MISRVTVLLPFVPVIETTGIRRSASRIHVGGVERASAIRGVHRASRRSWAPVSRARTDGRHVAFGQGEAASAMRVGPFRAGPRERDDPVARIRRAVDADPAAALAVLRPEAPRPVDDAVDWPGQRRAGDLGREPDERVATGSRWPYQVRRRPIATSTLTTGSSR